MFGGEFVIVTWPISLEENNNNKFKETEPNIVLQRYTKIEIYGVIYFIM